MSLQFQQPEPRRQTYSYSAPLTAEEIQAKQEAAEAKAIENMGNELRAALECEMTKQGYLPPTPPPLLLMRGLKILSAEYANVTEEKAFAQAMSSLQARIRSEGADAMLFVENVRLGVAKSLFRQFQTILARSHPGINQASVSDIPPTVLPDLAGRMQEIDHFLAEAWTEEPTRGVMAVHLDEATNSTIVQIGIAKFGSIYITIPAVLSPEDYAIRTLRTALGRLGPFTQIVDPMALIDGRHQGLNYNAALPGTRVVRAFTSDTARLAENLREAKQRERLSPENTTIINTAPRSLGEYQATFKGDQEGRSWPTWQGEAQQWDQAATSNGFESMRQVNAERFVDELSTSKNVIVINAHSDGKSLHLPDPLPDGTTVTREFLDEHRGRIAANRPFVYLFSCRAGMTAEQTGIASMLLDCGASGVVASQLPVGSADGQEMLRRLLAEKRGTPPLADFYDAMREKGYRDMEVFLG